MLAAEGTRCRAVFSADETRTFVAVRERDTGRSMLLNARGPARSPRDAAALEQLFDETITNERVGWVAGCGSLPSAFPADFYARTARRAHAHNLRFVADCDGEPLRLAVQAGCDLLVPNQHEAARLVQHDVNDVASAARAAQHLRTLGPATVAVTIGADGAVFATAQGLWHAQPPALEAGSAVGAGDVFLAALLLHLDRDEPGVALAHAVAAGTATLLARGHEILDPSDAQRVLSQVSVTQLQ
jgi:6-phosphofructokinase 2